MEPKRFYRSRSDRKVAGVAAGLGDYFEIDPILIRLIFVVLLFAGGGGMLIYIILWIITPEQPFQYNPGNTQNTTNESTGGTSYSDPATQPAQSPSHKPEKEKKKGSLVGGLVLITLGLLFLADEFFPGFDFSDFWPVIIIVIGVGLLINAFSGKHNKNQAL